MRRSVDGDLDLSSYLPARRSGSKVRELEREG